jgi:putative hydrolase of the HAD superfamily
MPRQKMPDNSVVVSYSNSDGTPPRTVSAVAFDIDGTLYPERSFNLRLLPEILFHPCFLLAFQKARKELHKLASAESQLAENNFYEKQAALCGSFLKPGTQKTFAKINTLIYKKWETFFAHIKPFPDAKELVFALKERGLKIGILSDFPVGKKLAYLGLDGLWDAELCSEEIGCLKPSPIPFEALAKSLGIPAGRILYVGNSLHFDHVGAKRAGLKTALIVPRSRRRQALSSVPPPDIVFSSYRELAAKLHPDFTPGPQELKLCLGEEDCEEKQGAAYDGAACHTFVEENARA